MGGSAGALLAFDTSGPVGSVAVGIDGVVRAYRALEERTEHASRLLPAIDEALRAAGIGVGELRAIVVGEGPGSFTGVRVAAATAKGLSVALGVPLRPVSSLAAAAAAAGVQELRYALFDARGERVYGACYRIGPDGLEAVTPPHPGELTEVLGLHVAGEAVFVGEGAARHRQRLEDAGCRVAADAGRERLAEGLLRCAGLGGAPEAPDASAWEPRYVRGSSAERLWSA